MNIRSSLRKKSIMALTAYLFLITILIGSVTYWIVDPLVKSELQRNLDLRAEMLVSNLEQKIASSKGVVSALVALAESEKNPQHLTKSVASILSVNHDIAVSGGLWPEPYTLNKNLNYNSLFFSADEHEHVDQIFSYNNPQIAPYYQEPWYVSVVNLPKRSMRWSDVYIDPYTRVPMLSLSMAYYVDNAFSGVATVDVSLASILSFIKDYAKANHLGVLLQNKSSDVLTDYNFHLKKNMYISRKHIDKLDWTLQVVNSNRTVSEEVLSQVFRIEFTLVPILLLCVMFGYYLISRYLIKPIVDISHEVDNSEGVITVDYNQDDEIGHLIRKFNKKTVYLEEEKVKAQASTAAKTAFLATLSHEIRTPMNGVLGSAQILLKSDLNPSQRQYLQSLYDSGGHMMTLLNEILDFSKIEQGHLELDCASFPMDMITNSINSVYRNLCLEKGLTFSVTSSIDVERWYNADKARLRQVLFNLINNAIKFTESGFVNVHLSEVTQGGQVCLRVEVKDSGIGISPEAQRRIFNPFEQAESATTRRFGGTGLGLAIVKQIVDLMQGHIEIQSEVNQGTCFTVSVPMAVVEAEHIEQQLVRTMDFTGLKVLIVEDNRTNTIIIDTFMKRKKFTTHCVTDGKQAIEALQSQPFDMILMDNHMPVMDGVESITGIRALASQYRNILIFGCTADVFKETRERMLNAGADYIIAKPVDESELDDALQTFADKLYQYQPKLRKLNPSH